MHYHYCPQCGSKLVPRQAGDEGDVPYCEPCKRYWFDGFASCVIVLVYNEFDEIVLIKQHYISETYTTFTAGYIKPGESAEETAIREVKEELGLDISKLTLVGTYWFAKNDLLMIGFMAYSPKQEFTLSSEVNSAEWVAVEEAPKTMFPDQPGNALWRLYYHYLNMIGKNG